jgi:hypothetical protein
MEARPLTAHDMTKPGNSLVGTNDSALLVALEDLTAFVEHVAPGELEKATRSLSSDLHSQDTSQVAGKRHAAWN